jgi:hypothetical protein
LKRLLADDPIRAQRVADLLDGLEHGQRVEATRALGRAEQRALYEAVDGHRSVRLCDLVPPEVDALVTVRHFGRNTSRESSTASTSRRSSR